MTFSTESTSLLHGSRECEHPNVMTSQYVINQIWLSEILQNTFFLYQLDETLLPHNFFHFGWGSLGTRPAFALCINV